MGQSLSAHLHEICSGLVAAFSSDQQPVHVDYRYNNCAIPTKLVQPLTLIVNEMILNALKYAHPAGVPLRLSVACDVRGNALVLTVDDDGIGLPEGFDPAKDGDLGFRVIRSLCQELHAVLDVQFSSLACDPQPPWLLPGIACRVGCSVFEPRHVVRDHRA